MCVLESRSLVSDSLGPCGSLCPWIFPGKSTGVDCHFSSPRDLPDPGVKPASPALAGGFFTTVPPRWLLFSR